MPLALVVIGLLLVVVAAKGNFASFGKQVAGDFQGPKNFLYWIAGIGVIGALGYVKQLRTISNLMLILIVIAIMLSNKGFFAQFQNAINQGPVQSPDAPAALNPSSTSGGALDTLKSIGSVLGPVGMFAF
jgi:hypothetical protein